eukprot:2732215-Rhodomonas_salina.1
MARLVAAVVVIEAGAPSQMVTGRVAGRMSTARVMMMCGRQVGGVGGSAGPPQSSLRILTPAPRSPSQCRPRRSAGGGGRERRHLRHVTPLSTVPRAPPHLLSPLAPAPVSRAL